MDIRTDIQTDIRTQIQAFMLRTRPLAAGLLCLLLGPLVRRMRGHLKRMDHFKLLGQNGVHHAVPFNQHLAFERFRDDHANELRTAAIGNVFDLLQEGEGEILILEIDSNKLHMLNKLNFQGSHSILNYSKEFGTKMK